MTPSIEKWETVAGDDRDCSYTQRLKVPGGWLYRHGFRDREGGSMCFVPEPFVSSWKGRTGPG